MNFESHAEQPSVIVDQKFIPSGVEYGEMRRLIAEALQEASDEDQGWIKEALNAVDGGNEVRASACIAAATSLSPETRKRILKQLGQWKEGGSN